MDYLNNESTLEIGGNNKQNKINRIEPYVERDHITLQYITSFCSWVLFIKPCIVRIYKELLGEDMICKTCHMFLVGGLVTQIMIFFTTADHIIKNPGSLRSGIT